MSISTGTLTGISNENEFYSNYYLSAILKDDIKGVAERWQAQDLAAKENESPEKQVSPPKRLGQLASNYFRIRDQFRQQRNEEERVAKQREWLRLFLPALGYELTPDEPQELEDGTLLPVLARVEKGNGTPLLWVLEVQPGDEGNEDVLSLPLSDYALPGLADSEVFDLELEDVISDLVLAQEEPPRWVMVVSLGQVMLIDRFKWNASRLLSFDLGEILSRRDAETLLATATLLHREHTCPEEGSPLLDDLDENSHKHAYAVSDDLKYALRRSIELLGNEAVWYLRDVSREGVFGGRLDPEQLSLECLRYMYRLLFVFYIEARQELGYAPMDSEIYRQGYSLESLRELEQTNLRTAEDSEGYFIDASLKKLFELIWEGYPPLDDEQQALNLHQEEIVHDTFSLAPLKSHLFDPARLKLLSRVRFRNSVLREVIELMSLSKANGRAGKGGKGRKRRGRISYAQLGINQLGAVYEALLSFRGFFAEEDLYEVKKAQDKAVNPLEVGYFVPAADLEKYHEEERVYNADGTPTCYGKGTFIYRLAGRDRENSASYYTPESLTKCLVKYTLKELLKDKTADDILELRICEPAMGSAAFLNEAINQLSEKYLALKQEELKQKGLDERISHEQYLQERQKVKMLLADRNVYGIDLNPVAVELAEISLWLNSIYKPEGGRAFVPWFGMHLHCGNSLIGARRQVYDVGLIPIEGAKKAKGKASWWWEQEPERVLLPEKLGEGQVYHFLLPDFGMADYQDKVIKALAPEQIGLINDWRKSFCKDPWAEADVGRLVALSQRIDELWMLHGADLQRLKARTTDSLDVWGQEPEVPQRVPLAMKDKIHEQEMLSQGVSHSGAYRRLKLVMDYWCALWFWPIEAAGLLPSRQEFLLEVALILGEYELAADVGATEAEQLRLFPETNEAAARQLALAFGRVDVGQLKAQRPRVALVERLAAQKRFFHWELEFADVFVERGGFDLFLGNPPWIKVEWQEGGILGDYNPLVDLRKLSASDLAKERAALFEEHHGLQASFLDEYETADGVQNFLNAYQNYPLLKGSQTNLFKCFLPQTWNFSSKLGVTGLLHPEGVFDDPKGQTLRRSIYPKLKLHLQFENEKQLFPIGGTRRYGINVYSQISEEQQFSLLSNLFHPKTVDICFEHNGLGEIGGIKDDENNWNVDGHAKRIVDVGEKELSLFAKLYDSEGTAFDEARLPTLHSEQLIRVLKKFSEQETQLSDYESQYLALEMWHETNAQKDGTTKRHTKFPEGTSELILSGPHFHVGNPINKSPRTVCTEKGHYDMLDLAELPDDYLPRTNYVPACAPEEYRRRTPTVPWGSQQPVTDFYRLVYRKMLSQSGERTLIPAIAPRQVAHIDGCFSLAFEDVHKLVQLTALSSSLPYDFFIKTTGKSNFRNELAELFACPEISAEAFSRTLALNCLTTHYAALWAETFAPAFTTDHWTKPDPRLPNNFFSNLTPTWQRHNALRTDYARRQALVEIDVLAAMALGLTLDELITIYRVQFPVMRQYEKETYYDQTGRIVFTVSKGLPGVGFPRTGNKKQGTTGWEDIQHLTEGTVSRTITDDTLPGGPRQREIVYQAPFDKCDRETDYRTAWAAFEKRLE